MDVSVLKRNPAIMDKVMVAQDNGTLIASKPMKIMFPRSWLNGKLGSIDENFNVLGMFIAIVGDEYSLCNVAAIMPFTPDGTNVVVIDEVQYMELSWEAGSVICPNTDLIKNDQLVYLFYDEIVAKGKAPWYMNYLDVSRIFDTCIEYAGVNLGAGKAILDIFTASRARVPGKRSRYFRETLEKQSDLLGKVPDMIAQRNVAYGATNTTARLFGAYQDEGINSALVNPAVKSEAIEELLRK